MKKIAVVGLGYVGLPLAVAFGEKREVVGFDINAGRIAELKDGVDFTREVSREELAAANKLSFTDSLDGIADCQVYIVTVPTPIDEFKTPDLTPLVKASESVGKVLKAGDIVIYAKYGGTEIKVDEDELVILRESDILAKKTK